MGLLDGGLASLINGAFGGLLLPGVLHRTALVDDGAGSLSAGPDADVPIRVMVDPATKTMRQTDGFQERDVSLLILAFGVPFPDEKDEVTVTGGQHSGRYLVLNPIQMDAAQTNYIVRGRAK